MLIPLNQPWYLIIGTARGVLFSLLLAVPAAAQGDKALGEYLSSECVTCHQITGKYEGIPPIIGWPEATFIAIMDEYRKKKRQNPIMQTIAGRFSADEIAALAAYFGSLPVQSGK
jgi:cytochrome c